MHYGSSLLKSKGGKSKYPLAVLATNSAYEMTRTGRYRKRDVKQLHIPKVGKRLLRKAAVSLNVSSLVFCKTKERGSLRARLKSVTREICLGQILSGPAFGRARRTVRRVQHIKGDRAKLEVLMGVRSFLRSFFGTVQLSECRRVFRQR